MTQAFVFPGQGSQAVGMGQALAEAFPSAREIFEEVDDALSQNLSRLMFEGPQEDLTLTENTQPALMAVSIAVVRALQTEGGVTIPGTSKFVAGHSLGEYSALAATEAMTVADAARLLKKRGQAMQNAVPVGEGAMTAVLGLSLEDVRAVAEEVGQGDLVCDIANDNAPGQVVLSGSKAAIDQAMLLAKEKGAKRAMPLPVSAPFHCRLLKPAADVMAGALEGMAFEVPIVPVVANVTAVAEDDPDRIAALLVDQVTAMVRWRESVVYMKENGVETLVEVGAGKVLGNLAKRIDPDLKGISIQDPAGIESYLKTVT